MARKYYAAEQVIGKSREAEENAGIKPGNNHVQYPS
jgi:hypothetical protein